MVKMSVNPQSYYSFFFSLVGSNVKLSNCMVHL